MIPGSMNKRITVEKKTVAKNSGGVPTNTWAEYVKLWANKYVRNGNMQDGDHSSRTQEDVEWTMWYRDDITYDMRIKYNNQYYRIEFIDEVGNKDGLRIVTNVIRQGQ